MLCNPQNYKIMSSNKQSLKTSLTDLINLKNLKTAFKFWEDRTYQEKCVAVLYFKSDTDQKAPVAVYGLKEFCDFFSTLKFHPEYIHQLAAIREEGRAIFNESFLNQLQRFQFRFDLKAVPEGYLATDADALLCLYASKIELKIIEYALVNIYSEQNSAEGYNFELEISAFNTDILPALNDNNFIEICREGKMLYFF